MNDELETIRTRHERCEPREGFYVSLRDGQQAHADRATLLRALDEAQERAERAEVKPLEWSPYNHARGVAGEYQWSEWLPAGYRAVFFPTGKQCGTSIGEMHPSQDAAKAACQQHYAEQVAALLAPGVAAVNAPPELLALREENARMRKALTTIGHSLVCAPTDYAEHNARELLKAGNIARAALNQETDNG